MSKVGRSLGDGHAHQADNKPPTLCSMHKLQPLVDQLITAVREGSSIHRVRVGSDAYTVQRLNGGLMNFVFRIQRDPFSSSDESSWGMRGVIIKHAEPHIAGNRAFLLDPGRIAFEFRALSTVSRVFPEFASYVPRAWFYDASNHTLVMEDLGNLPDISMHLVTLASAGISSIDTQAVINAAQSCGGQLGRFLRTLHSVSGRHEATLAEQFRNDDIQRVRFNTQYAAVRHIVPGTKPSIEAGASRADVGKDPSTVDVDLDWDSLASKMEAFGEQLRTPGECLIMGDLWPRSVLVAQTCPADGNKQSSGEDLTADGEIHDTVGAKSPCLASPELRIIDWEMCHWGRPAQDIAHFAAHVWMWWHQATFRSSLPHSMPYASTPFDDSKSRTHTPESPTADDSDSKTPIDWHARPPWEVLRDMSPIAAGELARGMQQLWSSLWTSYATTRRVERDSLASVVPAEAALSPAAVYKESFAADCGLHFAAELLVRASPRGPFFKDYLYDAGVTGAPGMQEQQRGAVAVAVSMMRTPAQGWSQLMVAFGEV